MATNKYWLLWDDSTPSTSSSETITWSTVTKIFSGSTIVSGSTNQFNSNIWHAVEDTHISASHFNQNYYEMYAYITNNPNINAQLVVNPDLGPVPVVDTGSLTQNLGDIISYQINATNSPYLYFVLDLPNGLELNKDTGVISGTLNNTGSISIPMFATNKFGTSNESLLTIVVENSSTPPPLFEGCGPANWPSREIGVPYSNIGNTLTGLTMIGGDTHFEAAKWFDPDPFVPFVAMTTDGTQFTTNGGGGGAVYLLPVTVMGDFTATYEILAISELSKQCGWMMLDQDLQRYMHFDINDYTPIFSYGCRYADNTTNTEVEFATGSHVNVRQGNPDFYKPMVLQRRGTVLSCSYNGVTFISYDFTTVFGMNLAFYFFGDTAYQIRNISVTQP